ncbi:MAG: hypothetical protein Ct9H300mP27_01970 [Chloroflexota bacterium]|nr:MAG: hypothetical protein Ct9H300mP27_01970 [Chloroflexota bacterium]
MTISSDAEIKELQDAALEHLWVYLREPSDMAEKGEPQIFVEGKGCQVTDALGNPLYRCHVRSVAEKRWLWADGDS